MASIKKGQLTAAPSSCAWWKHLRRVGKAMFWRRHRKVEKRLANAEVQA